MLCTGDMKTYYLNISLPGNQTLGSQKININSAYGIREGVRKELMSSVWSLKKKGEKGGKDSSGSRKNLYKDIDIVIVWFNGEIS